MKEGIHPKKNQIQVNCTSCETKHSVISTRGQDFAIEICSKCHPFYTGVEKIIDTEGRVDAFERKREQGKKALELRKAKQAKILEKKARVEKEKEMTKNSGTQLSLKDMLKQFN